MKKEDLIYTLNFLNYLTPEDLIEIDDKNLENLLNSLIFENKIMILKPSENKLGKELIVPGPDIQEAEGQLLIESERRDINQIYWNKVMRRFKDIILNEIKNLKIEIVKLYDTPENLEKKYFDISLKYHTFYNYFFNLNLNNELKVKIKLDKFEEILNHLQDLKNLIKNITQ